jgi:hypothetical protein
MALTMRAFPEAGSDQRANGGGLVGAAIFEEMGRCLTGTTGDWNKEEADQIRTQTTTCAQLGASHHRTDRPLPSQPQTVIAQHGVTDENITRRRSGGAAPSGTRHRHFRL